MIEKLVVLSIGSHKQLAISHIFEGNLILTNKVDEAMHFDNEEQIKAFVEEKLKPINCAENIAVARVQFEEKKVENVDGQTGVQTV